MSCSMIKYDDVRQMHIELSSKCNASCPGCPRNVSGGYTLPWLDTNEWTLQQFQDTFDQEFLGKLKRVLMCGNFGDPGTCVDLFEIVKYIKESNWNCEVRIHTNGGMRSPKFWGKLAGIMNPHKDMTIWSIDGLEDTNHIYRKKVKWNKLIANVKAYNAAGGPSTWEYLVFGHNQHQVQEAKQLSEKMGFVNFFYKKAFGFTEEKKGMGLDGMNVLDDVGDVEYFIPAPDDNWLNSSTLEQAKVKGSTLTKRHELSKEVFIKHFKYNEDKLEKDIQNGAMDWLDSARNIDCMHMREREIYIDARGGVHPCCFLGHVSQNADGIINMQYYQWLKQNVGFDNINILKHGLRGVLDNTEYFEKIRATWDIPQHKDGRIAQCTKHCQTKNNPIDSLYESLKSQNNLRKKQISDNGYQTSD